MNLTIKQPYAALISILKIKKEEIIMKIIKSGFSVRNGILYRENIKKVEKEEEYVTKTKDEKELIFLLKNGSRLIYLLDRLTLTDALKRLSKGVCGVLRLGSSNERIDLNQVDAIIVDGKHLFT